ncbi:MAG: hypothetical protein JW726_11310, partial [Anaerolineales bacterium]|nr:hypothetical protein [Anaerolineales bacterium]
LGLWGLIDNKLAVYYGAAVLLVALLVIYLLRKALQPQPIGSSLALLILFAGGLVLHGDYPSPKNRLLGGEAKEQAVVFLSQQFEEGTLVASSSPGPVWMAKMEVANLTSTDVPLDRTPEAFVEWLDSQQVQAVFVDQTLSSNNPKLWGLLEAQIGIGLERIFSADEGDIQILRIK